MCCGKSSIPGIKVSPGLCEVVSLFKSQTWLVVQEEKDRKAMEGTKDNIKCYHKPLPPGTSLSTVGNNLWVEKIDGRLYKFVENMEKNHIYT